MITCHRVQLPFAIFHPLLFLFYRRDRAIFYFALFTATLAIWGIIEHQSYFPRPRISHYFLTG